MPVLYKCKHSMDDTSELFSKGNVPLIGLAQSVATFSFGLDNSSRGIGPDKELSRRSKISSWSLFHAAVNVPNRFELVNLKTLSFGKRARRKR